MLGKNVLVVALDGMDYGLIKQFDLNSVKQSEFGNIDNQTDMKYTYTSELFASFITGTNYEDHGVTKLRKRPHSFRQDIVERLIPGKLANNVRGFGAIKRTLMAALKAKEDNRKHRKEDLKVETLFEEIDHSRAMFVPAYNPSMIWAMDAGMRPTQFDYSVEETLDFWDRREFEYRKNQLTNEIERIGARPFLMAHFHRPDFHHHYYGDEQINFDRDKLKSLYLEMEEFVKKVKDKALDSGYDYVIFMSDHGLPAGDGHNENAFYSCNRELFGDKKPHITDFHDKILELTDK